MKMEGLLLIIMLRGIPSFILPMPDFQTCEANAQAMNFIIEKKEANAFCFDLKHQAIDTRAFMPTPSQGEHIE
jgi:hypothetical protein